MHLQLILSSLLVSIIVGRPLNDWDADPVLSDFSSLKITVPFEESDKIRIQIAEEEEPNNSNKESSAAHPLTSELVISDFANSNIKFPEEVMQNRNKNKTNLIVMQNDTPNQIEDSYEIVVVSCNSVNNRNSKVVITPCFPMPGQIITVDKSNIKGTTEKDEVNKTVTSDANDQKTASTSTKKPEDLDPTFVRFNEAMDKQRDARQAHFPPPPYNIYAPNTDAFSGIAKPVIAPNINWPTTEPAKIISTSTISQEKIAPPQTQNFSSVQSFEAFLQQPLSTSDQLETTSASPSAPEIWSTTKLINLTSTSIINPTTETTVITSSTASTAAPTTTEAVYVIQELDNAYESSTKNITASTQFLVEVTTESYYESALVSKDNNSVKINEPSVPNEETQMLFVSQSNKPNISNRNPEYEQQPLFVSQHLHYSPHYSINIGSFSTANQNDVSSDFDRVGSFTIRHRYPSD